MRDTDSLYETIIEGWNRIANNISSINTEKILNIDTYLQIKPKFKEAIEKDSEFIKDDYTNRINEYQSIENKNKINDVKNLLDEFRKFQKEIEKIESDIWEYQKNIRELEETKNNKSYIEKVFSNLKVFLYNIFNIRSNLAELIENNKKINYNKASTASLDKQLKKQEETILKKKKENITELEDKFQPVEDGNSENLR